MGKDEWLTMLNWRMMVNQWLRTVNNGYFIDSYQGTTSAGSPSGSSQIRHQPVPVLHSGAAPFHPAQRRAACGPRCWEAPIVPSAMGKLVGQVDYEFYEVGYQLYEETYSYEETPRYEVGYEFFQVLFLHS